MPLTDRLISLLLPLLLVGLLLVPARAAEEDFPTWLAGLRAEAQAGGIRPATLDRALAGIEPIPRVIELDRQQPESTITYAAYLDAS